MVISVKTPYGKVTVPFIVTGSARWDFLTSENVTIFNADLGHGIKVDDVGVTGTASQPDGKSNAGAQVLSGQTTGRYYFEVTWSNVPGGSTGGICVAPTGTPYPDLVGIILPPFFCPGGVLCDVDGHIFTGGVWRDDTILVPNGMQNGDVVGVAVDLIHGNVWFKVVAGPDAGFDPDWNGGAAGGIGAGSNPTGNVLGIPIPFGVPVPFGNIAPFAIVNTANSATETMTLIANFGETPFAIGAAIPIFYQLWPPAGSGPL